MGPYDQEACPGDDQGVQEIEEVLIQLKSGVSRESVIRTGVSRRRYCGCDLSAKAHAAVVSSCTARNRWMAEPGMRAGDWSRKLRTSTAQSDR